MTPSQQQLSILTPTGDERAMKVSNIAAIIRASVDHPPPAGSGELRQLVRARQEVSGMAS